MNILQYLQHTQHLSRRSIVNLIKGKKILVNGNAIESFKHPISIEDKITIESTEYFVQEIEKETKLIIFNKPKGYVVSKSDPHNTTIYEIIPLEFQFYYYIGRLDKESRGLLLLTNSPEIVHQYEHPKFNIQKEYLIQLSSPLSVSDIQKTKRGVVDDGDVLKFREIIPIAKKNQYKVTLSEGKKRHIRRVIKVLKNEVIDLQRIKEGEYDLGNIQEGSRKEVVLNS